MGEKCSELLSKTTRFDWDKGGWGQRGRDEGQGEWCQRNARPWEGTHLQRTIGNFEFSQGDGVWVGRSGNPKPSARRRGCLGNAAPDRFRSPQYMQPQTTRASAVTPTATGLMCTDFILQLTPAALEFNRTLKVARQSHQSPSFDAQ